MSKLVKGFSKLSKADKINWLAENFFLDRASGIKTLEQYVNKDHKLQQLHDEFIENTISNFYVPYAIAPNFVINGKSYAIPMAIEESSVVAAASLTAKFWSDRGGFKADVISTRKVGQVHFIYKGSAEALETYFDNVKDDLIKATDHITENMRKRGGGIVGIELRDKRDSLDDYYQLHVTFETGDSMGANFINSCLEAIASSFEKEGIQIVMSILSNYVPECLVSAEVSCKVKDFFPENPRLYAEKFVQAVDIAKVEPYRAVTHNKGIMNGIDAVVLATGNDFRAVAAGAHAYACRDGKYRSLTNARIEKNNFIFSIELPLSLGTVGGLTKLHPLAKLSLEILQNPTAQELMQIVAVAGLAQNFAALRALTTTGIQQGHMKMHLLNILNQLEANVHEKEVITKAFNGKTVSHSAVAEYLHSLRTEQ
ncbi:hydroxymethylglutaryl-CoA reductase, degradative [Lutimonas saemankumensis]|uniref:hydroxymethylglutaryl-CoA reductase, degradative n=1 Tax=Lutimonas saemankumensis TaxID=483016 RepID=UPI001CD6CBB1|nr:hydroxymethylglutaryl-CoA reductase, degradative [Lutimonas saemankumensis]MCA0932915.1 hydroxymethylglutaryl-CoA reductase, degradative [Lutimonas saemankumensis]